MSSIFFNGRSWVSPAVMSAVDDSQMYGRSASGGNKLALIGTANGGQPNAVLKFGSASEARSVLRSGTLLDGIERAFDASAQSPGPSSIVAIRVGNTTDATLSNRCTQSSLILKDAANGDAINLLSTNYGVQENQIKVKVEAGTNEGLKITTQYDLDYYAVDDLVRNALSVRYTGAGAGTMTVSQSDISLTLNSVTEVISLASYGTVQSLSDRLNAVTGLTAVVLDGNGEKLTLNSLDSLSGADIKSAAVVVTANLQAAVDWFNSAGEGFVTATRAVGGSKVPAPLSFTYLAGGNNGSVTNTEWDAAFTTLESEDVQWVVPLSSSASIHAMAGSHVSYMSDVARQERRAICGTASGTSDKNAVLAAKMLNSDRVSLTHLGIYDYDSAGRLVMFEPYIAAAMVAGAFAGLNPGTPMTNKTLKIRGVERKLRNPTDTDDLIIGGVLCIEDTPNGYKVVQSISTWLINDNYNRREVSVGVAMDFTMHRVRATLDELRGSKNNPITMNLAISRTDSVLRSLAVQEPSGPGVLAGNQSSPAYRDIVAIQEGDSMRIEFQASFVLPNNFIPVVCYAKPYSGSSATSNSI